MGDKRMADKKKAKPEKAVMDFETFTGIRDYQDITGRTWRVRVHTLGTINRFHSIFNYCGGDKPQQAHFYAYSLQHPAPGIWIRIKRFLGWSDFSKRFILKNLPFQNVRDLLDVICRANMSKSFQQIADEAEAKAKENREFAEKLMAMSEEDREKELKKKAAKIPKTGPA